MMVCSLIDTDSRDEYAFIILPHYQNGIQYFDAPTLEAMMKRVVSGLSLLSTSARWVPSTLEMKWTPGPPLE